MWLWFLILPYELAIFGHVLIKFPGFLLTQAVCSFPQQSGSQWPVVSSYTALDMAGPAGHGNTALLLSTQQRALYKKTWISYEEPITVNRLLCPLHKSLIQRGYSFNKAFDSVEDAWLCCCGGTQPNRLRGEYRLVCTAKSSGSKYNSLIQGYKGEMLAPI